MLATSTSPGAQRPVHALHDGLGVGRAPGPHLGGDGVVDVLEVGVGDPVRRLPGQLGRVGAADEQVPGVEAQRRSPTPRAPAAPRAPVSTMVPDVRVQHGSHPVLGREAAIRSRLSSSSAPAVGVQLRAAVVAVEARHRREHQDLGAGRVVAGEDAVDLGERVVIGPVHQHRGEAADGGQLVRVRAPRPSAAGRRAGTRPGRVRWPTGRPPASRRAPARGVSWWPQFGHLADAPGDGGAGDPARAGWRWGNPRAGWRWS